MNYSVFVRNIRKEFQLCITLFTKYLNLQNLKHDEIINIDSLILKNLIYCINYNFFFLKSHHFKKGLRSLISYFHFSFKKKKSQSKFFREAKKLEI